MARTIYIDRLLRLTLTRRGKAVAKHPLLRENAVEAVKGTPVETTKANDAQSACETPGLARYASGRYQ